MVACRGGDFACGTLIVHYMESSFVIIYIGSDRVYILGWKVVVRGRLVISIIFIFFRFHLR